MKLSYSPRGARRGALLGVLILASWLAWASWFIQSHEPSDQGLPLVQLHSGMENHHQHMSHMPNTGRGDIN